MVSDVGFQVSVKTVSGCGALAIVILKLDTCKSGG
jgi:hypothetical protein